MCLSVPAKVLNVNGNIAEVSIGGTLFTAGIQLVEDIKPGDYILLHAGFAIRKLSADEAEETINLLNQVSGFSETDDR